MHNAERRGHPDSGIFFSSFLTFEVLHLNMQQTNKSRSLKLGVHMFTTTEGMEHPDTSMGPARLQERETFHRWVGTSNPSKKICFSEGFSRTVIHKNKQNVPFELVTTDILTAASSTSGFDFVHIGEHAYVRP